MVYLFGIAAFFATLLGGLFALHKKDQLHLILGFSAGAVIGVAFFDLLPESIGLASGRYDTATVTSVVALGFLIFMVLNRVLFLHPHSNDDPDDGHNHQSALGAGSLSIHSFLDGMGIGLAFQVSVGVGLVVAVAVLAHDFSDGINTVSYILKNYNDDQRARRWLYVDALAPLLGVVATRFFTLSDSALGIVLALFCGFFMYIGASDLIPESHHRHPQLITSLMTILGALVIYGAIRFAI